jgi:hypothetical protein
MDYPNMSYCMCGNTLAALEQVMEAMNEEGAVAFVGDLSREELRSFKELIHAAKTVLSLRKSGLVEPDSWNENAEAMLG